MLFENEIARVGYLSRSVPVGIDLKEAILKMKNEKIKDFWRTPH